MKNLITEIIAMVAVGVMFFLTVLVALAMVILPFAVLGACVAVVVIVVRALTGI